MTAIAGYVRVSTDEQGASGLGLEAQRAAILARFPGADIVEEVKSTKKVRPVGDALLARARAGEVETVVVASNDRLCRDMVEFVTLLGEVSADRCPWALVMLDLEVDTRTASGKLLAHVKAAVAQWERDRIGERTRAALAAKRARGEWVGRRRVIPAEVEARIRELRSERLTYRAIAATLNAEGVPAASGRPWGHSTVAAVLTREEVAA